MRCVVQRCARAQVSVDGEVVGSVGRGFMVLCGVEEGDSAADMEYCRGTSRANCNGTGTYVYSLTPILCLSTSRANCNPL